MSSSFPLFPPSASSVATEMDLLYLFIVSVCAFFTVLVTALVIVFTIKYRRRHPAEVGADIHGSLALECSTPSIALDIHLEDCRVMDEAIDRGQRHSLIWKDFSPFAKWLIGGDQH